MGEGGGSQGGGDAGGGGDGQAVNMLPRSADPSGSATSTTCAIITRSADTTTSDATENATHLLQLKGSPTSTTSSSSSELQDAPSRSCVPCLARRVSRLDVPLLLLLLLLQRECCCAFASFLGLSVVYCWRACLVCDAVDEPDGALFVSFSSSYDVRQRGGGIGARRGLSALLCCACLMRRALARRAILVYLLL